MNSEERLGIWLDRSATRICISGAFVAVCLFILRVGAPLSWDEAVYATRADDLSRTNFNWEFYSGSYWSDLRAPGFPAILAAIFRVFGATDFVARIVTVAFALLLMLTIAWMLDRLYRPRVGTSAMLLIAACPGFLVGSTLAFADIPAAAVSALAVLVIVDAWAHRRTIFLFLIPVLSGIATTMRFGASMLAAAPLVIFGAAIIIRGWRDRRRDEIISTVTAGAATAIVVYLLLSTKLLTRTSTPLDAKYNRMDAVGKPRFQAFTDIVDILHPGRVGYGFGSAFWGWSFAVAFGLLTVAVICRLLVAARFKQLLLCLLVAVTPLLLYVLAVRGFVTTYLAPLYAIGAAMVATGYWTATDERPSDEEDGQPAETASDSSSADGLLGARTGTTVLAVVVAAYALIGWSSVRANESMHRALGVWDGVRLTSQLAGESILGDCKIATVRTPQVSWYSDCRVYSFVAPSEGKHVSESELPEYLDRLEAHMGISGGGWYGLIIIEPFGGQPSIATAQPMSVARRSIVIGSESAQRRSALLVMVAD